MAFSMVACTNVPPATSSSERENNPPVEDDENDDIEDDNGENDNTQSSTTGSSTVQSNTTGSSTVQSSTSSSNNGGTTGGSPTQILTPDRINYEAKTSGTGSNRVIHYVNEMMQHPVMTSFYNGYASALTMTFDDGYDVGTGTLVSDIYEKFGWRGTMMLGPCFLGSDEIIKEWNNVFARGYLDVGCHGYNHKEPTTLDPSEYEHEIKDAIMFLREKFPGQRVLTFATPFAHINGPYEEYLSQFVIGNRLEAGGTLVNPQTNPDYNPFRVMAVSVNKSNPLIPVHSAVKTGIEKGHWTVELFHCVKPSASASTDIDYEVFEYHCNYLYRNYRDDLWFATFEEVLLYMEQAKRATIAYTDCDRTSMTFKVTPDSTLDKELYNFDMSTQIYLPAFADSAYATVNGEYQPLTLLVDQKSGDKSVIVKKIPATGESEVVVYLGANKNMRNNCLHRYAVDEIVEPTHEEGGYTINKCHKCEHTYNSAYTAPVHTFNGDVVVVIEPTQSDAGLAKHYCTHCDEYDVREVEYAGD